MKKSSLLINIFTALAMAVVLNNLLSNAFKYTSKGEVVLSVTVKTGEDGHTDGTVTLVFSVSDTGQGMTAEQICKRERILCES
ncbi:MAG: hypothetical protein LBI04_07560 [Treponema sp.]|jgi:two-component system chemotaxis sensor kinase CheA|nr:hypothetical protein [Treponema sp.]